MAIYFNELSYEMYAGMDYELYSVLEYYRTDPHSVKNKLSDLMIGKCDIYEYVKETDENGVTAWTEKLVLTNIKCRLSHRISAGESLDRTFIPEPYKQYQLFTLPDIDIRANSKVVVTQNGVMGEFSNTGIPSRYEFHNQIELIPFVRWVDDED